MALLLFFIHFIPPSHPLPALQTTALLCRPTSTFHTCSSHPPHALYLYQTPLSYLTSFHLSVCPSILLVFSLPLQYFSPTLSFCIRIFFPCFLSSLRLTQSFYQSSSSISFFFLIHIHVISRWQPGAAVRDCYFVLKVLKAHLIYSNNLGYIQKYHYRNMDTHRNRQSHIHTQIHTESNFLLAPATFCPPFCSKFSAYLLGWATLTFRHTILWYVMDPRGSLCSLSAVVCVSLSVLVSFTLVCLKLWGKWEMQILKSHEFIRQQGRIDWICSELQ